MTFESLRKQLPLGEFDESFASGWEISEAVFPATGLFFLEKEYIFRYGELVRLPEEAIDSLVEAARVAAGSPALCHLLWHEHSLLREKACARAVRRSRWPLPGRKSPPLGLDRPETDPSGFPDLGGEEGWGLNLIVALSLLPDALSFFEQRRIPKEILLATLTDFPVWHAYFHRHFAVHGISPVILGWLMNHLRGRLFRLCRLQFMRGELAQGISVYRRKAAQGGPPRKGGGIELCILAPAGMSVEPDGLYPAQLAALPGQERAPSARPLFQTARSSGGGWVEGNPVSEEGRVEGERIRLSTAEWRLVLERGSGVLEMHIPEDGRLEPEECARSVQWAVEFFAEYFPERPFSAFTCESWFLDPSLDAILPEASNMRLFARALHRYPVEGREEESLRRIFGPHVLWRGTRTSGDATRLQRGAASLIAAGGALRPGGGFLLKEELPWGNRDRKASGPAA